MMKQKQVKIMVRVIASVPDNVPDEQVRFVLSNPQIHLACTRGDEEDTEPCEDSEVVSFETESCELF